MNFKEYFLLTESKHNIVGLGFPEIIATFLQKKFDKNAYIIAKWFKEYYNRNNDENWWDRHMDSMSKGISLKNLTKLYQASFDPDTYVKTLEDLNYSKPDILDLPEQRQYIKNEIEKKLFNDFFFTYYPLMVDIINGKLTDIAQYKRMSFENAEEKYEKKNIFSDKTPIKIYANGFKWIDVGKRCPMVGKAMNNCGSAGLMSFDKEASIITLFGPENKPHVVVTYSPNEKRISGDQGAGSTAVKEKYHDYVLDLANALQANFDYNKSKSDLLRLKYILKDKATNIEKVIDDSYDEIFQFLMNGKLYYADRYNAIPADEIDKINPPFQTGNKIKDAFNHRNQQSLKSIYIPLNHV